MVRMVNAVNYNTSIAPESQSYKMRIRTTELAEMLVRFELLCEIRCATVIAL